MPLRLHRPSSRLRPALAVLLGLVALLLGAPRPARAAAVATEYRGAMVHSLWATETAQQMDEDLQMDKRAGANAVRLDVAWATLDSAGPGKLTAWYSQRLSQFMTEAHQLGLKVIAIAFTTPCWASSAPDSLKQSCQGDWWGRGVGWYPPVNDADYAAFVKYLTATYGSDLAAVEIWNEPDESTDWVSSNPTGDYAALLKAAYPAAKAGNATVPVLAGVLSGSDTAFLQSLYQDGIQGSYDGISLHSYCDNNPPGQQAGPGYTRYEFQSGLEAMHAFQLANGDSTPLWVTEFGWTTVSTSPQDAATFIGQAYQILAMMPFVKAGIVYELHDDIGGSSTDPEATYGLLNSDYTPKPAYAAFAAAMTAPGAPALSQPASGGAAYGTHPTLTFAAAPSSTIAVSIDGAYDGTATANASGTATYTVSAALADGQHTVAGVDTDAYGNVGPASSPAPFIVEPAAPQLVSPQNGASTTATRPTLTFAAAPGTSVAVTVDGAPAGTVSAGPTGSASITVPAPLAVGRHAVSATAADTLGYVSPPSAAASFTITAPALTRTPAASPHATKKTLAGASSLVRLRVTVAKLRRQRVPATCRITLGSLSRCQVTLYANGRRVGSATVRVKRSGHASATVQIRLNALGQHDRRAAHGRLKVTVQAAATLVGGRRVQSRGTARVTG